MCCALISIDSTLRSNLSVGLPLDTLLYRSGSLSSAGQHRITENDPYFNTIRKAWSEGYKAPSCSCRRSLRAARIRGEIASRRHAGHGAEKVDKGAIAGEIKRHRGIGNPLPGSQHLNCLH